jgi:hypothetical protein
MGFVAPECEFAWSNTILMESGRIGSYDITNSELEISRILEQELYIFSVVYV